MTILISCLLIASFVLCNVQCIKPVMIPETCTERFFSYPDDCTKFYFCYNGRPLKRSCGPDTHWNNRIKICDLPSRAKCVEVSAIHPKQKKPTPATTPKPTPVASPEPIQPPTPITTPEPTQIPTTKPTTKPRLNLPVKVPIVSEPPKKPITANKKVICYFTNWGVHRSEQTKFLPENIDTNLCNIIVYAYAALNPETLTIQPSNPAIDIDDRFFKRVTDLRQKGVKVLIALAGSSETVGDKYDRLVADEENIHKFLASVMAFIHKYNFDGLDIEYPTCSQYGCELKKAQAKQGFTRLVGSLSEAFKPNGWLLSTRVSANPVTIDASYDVPQLTQHLDWISLMTHDYHSSYDGETQHIAPLYSSDDLDIDSTVKYWIQKGVPRTKLILGIPSFGLSIKLKDPRNHGINAPSKGPAETGPFTNIPGTLAYYEICTNTKHNGWKIERDPENEVGAFAYHGDQWVSYDDVENVRAKARYIREKDIGGGMIWTLDFDDFAGRCGCGNYPLLTALNQEIRNVDEKSVQNCT